LMEHIVAFFMIMHVVIMIFGIVDVLIICSKFN
jgi:hypothetical protein